MGQDMAKANYFAMREYIRHRRARQGRSAVELAKKNRQTGRSATKRHNLSRPKEISHSSF
jgi:hypothetical protein